MSRAEPDEDAPERMPPAVFLERQSYRRRRLMDAARLLPLLGVLLFLLPLLWRAADSTGAMGGVSMSNAIIYVFAVWIGLIAAIFVFGKSTRPWSRPDDGPGTH